MKLRTLSVLLASAAVAASGLNAAQPASAGSAVAARWAPAATAPIHPGVMMYTAGAQCTANFVYTDARHRIYVGYAAHCAGTGSSTDTNGCATRSLPLGTGVTFNRGGNLVTEGTVVGKGRLAYSSWRTMRRLHTQDADTCAYNDLALVRVIARDKRKVNPSVPFWGGPTGIARGGTTAGDRVYTYGNSSLRAGVAALAPHTGASLGDDPADHGWSHPLYTVSPGVPGDSGSGFLDARGRALGVLSTLSVAPLPAANNIGDLGKELAFARRHSGIRGLRLVRGTTPFDPVL